MVSTVSRLGLGTMAGRADGELGEELRAVLGAELDGAQSREAAVAAIDAIGNSADDSFAPKLAERLDADLSGLSDSTRAMLPHLIAAARAMDNVFWMQAYGDRDSLLAGLDADTRRFATINYGPWDRLNGNEPFVEGVGPKPAGANYYPADITADAGV